MPVFINFTNHASSGWSQKQREEAEKFGRIIDIPFPEIIPPISDSRLFSLGEEYLSRITALRPDCVLCQGESVFSFYMVTALKRKNIRVVSAASKRIVKESVDKNGRTLKSSVFEFDSFRDYVLIKT